MPDRFSERNIVVGAAAAATAAEATTATEITIAWWRWAVVAATALATAAFAFATAEELHVIGNDLSDVAFLAFFVVVRPSLALLF